MPSVTATPPAADTVDAVRRFNRFYTRRIHILDEAHLKSDFSLAAVRVLYELAHRDAMSAADLGRELDLDAGYLSRILGDLGRRQLVTRQRAADDARVSRIRLTARGRARFAVLDARASDDIAALLAPLGEPSQRRLVAAMGAITAILDDGTSDDKSAQRPAPYLLRTHRPGDLGWMVWRHGVLYADEYGWDERFEALVAGIAAKFAAEFDPRWERAWIAEMGGEPVGSIFLVREKPGVAKLRLLLIEPKARGRGLGKRLVATAIGFAC